MTLSALGLVGGEKVMLEHKTREGKWPRYRYIEDPGFRQFRENDRVDAMDYQGRWFQGQVCWFFARRDHRRRLLLGQCFFLVDLTSVVLALRGMVHTHAHAHTCIHAYVLEVHY